MSNNISSLPHNDCCGCRACGDVCPMKCISFYEDIEHFFYPYVDESSCISCGKCQRICPAFNPDFNDTAKICLAAYAVDKEKRNNGSSGGIFGLLAETIIDKGGKVWGAAFDENLTLRHISADSIERLKPLFKSKYLQSNPSGCYSAIAQDVKTGVLTLFSGTPCQCNALINIVGNKPDNLFVVEVICHGVPSQYLFDKTIESIEKKQHYKITSFKFRTKYKENSRTFCYKYKKGATEGIVNGFAHENPFYFGFLKYITFRPSCYRCKWAKPERTADITLGDFWGIEKIYPSLNSHDGVSMIIVNSDKGALLMSDIVKAKSLKTFVCPISYAIDNNACLKHPTPKSAMRDSLFKDLDNKPFSEIINKYLKSKRTWLLDIYYKIPRKVQVVLRKIISKRMNYE